MSSQGVYAKGMARREEILETAMRVIADIGYHHASVRAIGRELGIEPAHILYYFGSREELFRELIERWDAKTLALDTSQDEGLELVSRALRRNLSLRGVVHLYLSFATEAAATEHPANPYFRERFRFTADLIERTVDAGQRASLIRAEVDAPRTARMLIALADGLQLQSLIDPDMDAPGDLDAFIDDLFVAGVRTRVRVPALR